MRSECGAGQTGILRKSCIYARIERLHIYICICIRYQFHSWRIKRCTTFRRKRVFYRASFYGVIQVRTLTRWCTRSRPCHLKYRHCAAATLEYNISTYVSLLPRALRAPAIRFHNPLLYFRRSARARGPAKIEFSNLLNSPWSRVR